jgi:cellulose synthase/poly-beta-1,6-N-acetylglucosamine synthase-like glycosyltransferase
MWLLEWFFWFCCAVVAYTYLFYPIFVVILNAIFRSPARISEPERQRGEAAGASLALGLGLNSVSVLLPVHNEEQNLARRLDELTRMIEASGGEIIVISDASTDRSADIARQHGARVIEMPTKQGKAAALNAGAAAAQHELLIFADARQRWADDAMARLIENFADPTIGAVSGDLVLESAPGVLAGVGLYWRFEKWLRKQESRLGSQVGVTGAISAVRRALFQPIPSGTLLDDVYWPMRVVLQGYRVVHDERALAFDRLPEAPRDEFRRKVRTLAGNFQLLTLLPAAALFPWSNRVWWQWISHKLMRLAVPWALLGMLISCVFLTEDIYQIFLWLQLGCYGVALLGLIPPLGRSVRLLGAGASFLVLNAAAWVAFWVWVTGRAGHSWHKVQYQEPGELPV